MFGDIGHGLILFLFGLFVIFKKKEVIKINSFFSMIVPHRYLITLMGFFATYCGFIYNDFLSINLNLFGSCYDLTTVK
jgi:V-type H+-transporting ATPase subunit a